MTVSIDYLCEAINDNFSEGDGMWISTVTSVLVTDVRPGDESLSTIMVRVSPGEYTGEATGVTEVPRDNTWMIRLGGEQFKARLSDVIFSADGVQLKVYVADIVAELDSDAQRVLRFLYEHESSTFSQTEITERVFDDARTRPWKPGGRSGRVGGALEKLGNNDLIYSRKTNPVTYGISKDGIDFVNTDRRFTVTTYGEVDAIQAEVDETEQEVDQ
jgi:hypothetical protein